MGKLYQLIEKQLNIVKNYKVQEETDYIHSKTFNKTFNAMKNKESINMLLGELNRNPEKYFDSKQAFKDFNRDNRRI